jgi:predicted amidohydrolase
MKICIAQIHPIAGAITENITAHSKWIDLARTAHADAIFFPELSLTSFEPTLAAELAMDLDDPRLDGFQDLSNVHLITIGIGLPTRIDSKIQISMCIFQPQKPRVLYSKQQLHEDEFPFFEPGKRQVLIAIDQCTIAPAICYESLQPSHAENACSLGAMLYLASVAKPENGLKKAFDHYPKIAAKYGIPVLMVNAVGFCDNFMSAGRSSVWSKEGILLGQLDGTEEGILIFDTESEEIIQKSVGLGD